MAPTKRSVIGRARTVLVSHVAAQPVACVTTVSAAVRLPGHATRLESTGSVRFTTETERHLEEIVVPAVDRIIEPLGAGGGHYELSVVNISAASMHDLGVEIEGHSLDTAAALAMLSASLRLPVRQDIVSTGQVASADGDIRPVGGLPEKIRAARVAPDIGEFLYPPLDQDGSLGALAPEARTRAIEALAAASSDLRISEIPDLAHLIHHVTTPYGRLQAALRAGYFYFRCRDDAPADGTRALVEGLSESFWQCLERDLYDGRTCRARRLLASRIRMELGQQQYPAGLGCRLMALVRSIPPAIRRRQGFFPLLPSQACFQVGSLASDADQTDATELLAVAIGQLGETAPPAGRQERAPAATRSMDELVRATLDAISAERLAREVNLPGDNARARFVLPSVIVEDYDLFNDTITAFHLALLRHTDESNPPAQPHEAMALLQRAYADEGGLPAARAEAKFAVNGGMRTIIDRCTAQYQAEQRSKRVNRVLAEALDPLDWEGQVAFTRALLKHLRGVLPEEMKDVEPARLARRRDDIVRAYVYGLDRVQRLVRTM